MSNEEKIKTAIEIKLSSLLNCVLNEIEKNPSFAKEIENILLSDSLKKTLKEKKNKKDKTFFNTLEFLQNQNVGELRSELNLKTITELKEIMKKDGNKKAKELKDLSREQIIESIIQNAQRKLNQGRSFLQ
ncbi:MAG: hypothetical protein ACYDEE_00010 [Ignavibacteriaceae bacterium]